MTAFFKKNLDLLIGLSLFIAVFYRLPMNEISFHDEVINTWKASAFHLTADPLRIFDYAGRPFSFLVNAALYRFFGPSPASFAFFSCIVIFSGYFLLRSILHARQAAEKMILTGLVLSSPLFFTVGTSGMINTILLAHLTILLWISTRHEDGQFPSLPYGLVTGLGMGIHPTFFYLAPGVILLALSSRRFQKKRIEFLKFVVGFALVAAFLEGSYWLVRHYSYFGRFLRASEKLDAYSGTYGQPFSYYWTILWKTYWPHFVLFAGSLALFARKSPSSEVKALLRWTAISLLTLLSASLISWKFPRVLLSFIPLVIVPLFLGYRLTLRYGHRWMAVPILIAFSVTIPRSLLEIHDHRYSQQFPRYKLRKAYADYLNSFAIQRLRIVQTIESIEPEALPKLVSLDIASPGPITRFYHPSATEENLLVHLPKGSSIEPLITKEQEAVAVRIPHDERVSPKKMEDVGFTIVMRNQKFVLYVSRRKLGNKFWERTFSKVER